MAQEGGGKTRKGGGGRAGEKLSRVDEADVVDTCQTREARTLQFATSSGNENKAQSGLWLASEAACDATTLSMHENT